jgi:hypothetical protein
MPLALGLEIGKKVHVGENVQNPKQRGTLTVKQIHTTRSFTVEVECQGAAHEYLITQQELIEVMPDILIGAGTRGAMDQARVIFDVPKHINVRRDEVPYRA